MSNELMNPTTTAPAALTAAEESAALLAGLDTDAAPVAYCSMTAETMEQRKILYNAANNPDHRLSEMIGQSITVKDIYVEAVQLLNTETGEVQTAPRCVLITPEGESYACVSSGVLGAIKKLFAVFGQPCEWPEPLAVTVKQIDKGNGKRILTLAAS